ncbi:MAG: Dabb family protein [Lachnospiraceae bacterium]|nr:Dabb family protein [Lachnospiraceae bacterium]
MIRHICMFTLKPENKEQTIAEFFDRAEALRKIDTIKSFQVVKNAEKTPDSNYDVALIFDFDTVEALDFYQKSPQHVEFGKYVSAVRIQRACIDYKF